MPAEPSAASAGQTLPAPLAALIKLAGSRAIQTRPGQQVVGELDPVTEVFVLTDGRLVQSVGQHAQRRITQLQRAPAVVGDRELLAGVAHAQESTAALGVCTLHMVPRAPLLAALRADAELHRALLVDIARRGAAAARICAHFAEPLERRVLTALWAAGVGDLPPYSDLAVLTDATEKSVGRALATLQRTGEVVVDTSRRFTLAERTRAELEQAPWLPLWHTWSGQNVG